MYVYCLYCAESACGVWNRFLCMWQDAVFNAWQVITHSICIHVLEPIASHVTQFYGCIVLRWKVIVSEPHWSGEFKTKGDKLSLASHTEVENSKGDKLWSGEFKRWQFIFSQPHWSGEFKRWQVIFSQPHWSGEFEGDNLSATHTHTVMASMHVWQAYRPRIDFNFGHSLKTPSQHLHGGKQAIDW